MGIDANGDRIPSYQIAYGNKDHKFTRFGNYFGAFGQIEQLNVTVVWHGGITTVPIGRPPCGFDNEFCPEKEKGKVFQGLGWAEVIVLLEPSYTEFCRMQSDKKFFSQRMKTNRVLKCDVIILQTFPFEPLNLIMRYTQLL